MRKILIAFVLYFVLCNPFLLYSQSNSQEQDKIQRTVSENMHIFTDSIPNYLLPNYGFNNRNEIQKAIIENPIKVYTIKNKEMIPTNTWRIPISIDGEYRALFTVIKEDNGEYLLVDFGAIRLAKEIQKRINGSTIYLLRIFELQTDFVFYGDFNKASTLFYPIKATESPAILFSDILKQL